MTDHRSELCAICLDATAPAERRDLPCGHAFDPECIRQWEAELLRQHRRDEAIEATGFGGFTCPVCRQRYMYAGDLARTTVKLADPSPPSPPPPPPPPPADDPEVRRQRRIERELRQRRAISVTRMAVERRIEHNLMAFFAVAVLTALYYELFGGAQQG